LANKGAAKARITIMSNMIKPKHPVLFNFIVRLKLIVCMRNPRIQYMVDKIDQKIDK
jgi:hypothetical protein